MSKLLIQTQVYENYAFDDEGRVLGGSQAYWKPKGGGDYVIKNFNGFTHRSIAESAEALVNQVRSQVERDDEYFQESIIGWTVVADDYLTEFERSQLEYEGKIRYPANEIIVTEA